MQFPLLFLELGLRGARDCAGTARSRNGASLSGQVLSPRITRGTLSVTSPARTGDWEALVLGGKAFASTGEELNKRMPSGTASTLAISQAVAPI